MPNLLEQLQLLENWEERYAYLIDLGKKLSPLPDEYRTNQYLVSGCVSKVWLCIRPILLQPQNCDIKYPPSVDILSDSDSLIIKGLLYSVTTLCQHQTCEVINAIRFDELLEAANLKRFLTPNRVNGFFAITRRIQNTCLNISEEYYKQAAIFSANDLSPINLT